MGDLETWQLAHGCPGDLAASTQVPWKPGS